MHFHCRLRSCVIENGLYRWWCIASWRQVSKRGESAYLMLCSKLYCPIVCGARLLSSIVFVSPTTMLIMINGNMAFLLTIILMCGDRRSFSALIDLTIIPIIITLWFGWRSRKDIKTRRNSLELQSISNPLLDSSYGEKLYNLRHNDHKMCSIGRTIAILDLTRMELSDGVSIRRCKRDQTRNSLTGYQISFPVSLLLLPRRTILA